VDARKFHYGGFSGGEGYGFDAFDERLLEAHFCGLKAARALRMKSWRAMRMKARIGHDP
jgi:hypothetical protein